MSSPIWTPAALSSEVRPYKQFIWRLVEAQHHISTLKLVDTLAEQAILESLIDDSKPPIPEDCRRLDYLLATPFRYGALYPKGSRFRRAGRTAGVYYGSEHIDSAVSEMAFYRMLFYAESPTLPWPDNAAEYRAFSVPVQSDRGLDLTVPPLDRDHAAWTDPVDYEPCQNLADQARVADIDVIRYAAVRDPLRANVVVLSCRSFAAPGPVELQTWRIGINVAGVHAFCAFPRLSFEFGRACFAEDPRLADMVWDRPSRRQSLRLSKSTSKPDSDG